MNNFCPECGSERIENSKYCINCGYKFPVENNPVSYTHLDVYKRQIQNKIQQLNYQEIYVRDK